MVLGSLWQKAMSLKFPESSTLTFQRKSMEPKNVMGSMRYPHHVIIPTGLHLRPATSFEFLE
jgi:hypothetical protein